MDEQNMNQAQEQTQEQAQEQAQQAPPQKVMQADADDAQKNKALAIVGYIFPILFFLPLLSEEGKKSSFAMFHANQQLNVLLTSIVLMVVNIIPLLGQIVWLFGSIALLVFVIMGIVNAAGGKMKELPIIGGFKLLS